MKTRLIVTVVVALLFANQTTVDDSSQPKIIMENEIKNEVVGTENYDEDDKIELEITENIIVEKQTKKVKNSSTSSAPITQEVRKVDATVDKQVVTEDGAGADTATTQPTSKDNLVYVEEFGYVEDSGPARGKTVHSDGDINKMVGTMD